MRAITERREPLCRVRCPCRICETPSKIRPTTVVITSYSIHYTKLYETGGSSVMQGMVELGEEIFHMPVRVGTPRYAGGLAEVVRGPRYATVVGLILEGVTQMQQGNP